MSQLAPITVHLPTAASELTSFKTWLAAVGFIDESTIVAQIKSRPQMACLLAASLGLNAPNLIKFELHMKGMFRTDLVLGNDALRQLVLTYDEMVRQMEDNLSTLNSWA